MNDRLKSETQKMGISEREQTINNDYKETSKGIELSGFFIVNDDNTVEWIDLLRG